MQSGTGNADQWFLEFDKNDNKPIDQVMSWIGSSDTTSQIRLKFENKEDATQYAQRNNILFFIDEGSEKKMNPDQALANLDPKTKFRWNLGPK